MLPSPPSRRRGLKYHDWSELTYHTMVASFSEAWIEILEHIGNIADDESPPSRRRGLKYHDWSELTYHTMVASFSEAWIEILLRLAEQNVTGVASFSEAWIEIGRENNRMKPVSGRLLLGGVD